MDVRFKLPERVVKVLDHLLSGGIESACAQHQAMRSWINQPYAACGYRSLGSICGT
jgi:hypothetical protein